MERASPCRRTLYLHCAAPPCLFTSNVNASSGLVVLFTLREDGGDLLVAEGKWTGDDKNIAGGRCLRSPALCLLTASSVFSGGVARRKLRKKLVCGGRGAFTRVARAARSAFHIDRLLRSLRGAVPSALSATPHILPSSAACIFWTTGVDEVGASRLAPPTVPAG